MIRGEEFDPSYMREYLTFQLMRSMGVCTERLSFAQVCPPTPCSHLIRPSLWWSREALDDTPVSPISLSYPGWQLFVNGDNYGVFVLAEVPDTEAFVAVRIDTDE